jgi:hypothetical protein
VRATLTVMNLAMAYMFLAMQLGTVPMTDHTPSMPGM